MRWIASFAGLFLIGGLSVGVGAAESPVVAPPVADASGDSIVVCGQKFPIGTRVILWSDPGGHNAYTPKAGVEDKPGALGWRPRRTTTLPPAQAASVEKNGWTLPDVQAVVDQFVIHYDVCGTSGKCFNVLRDRNLAVQFMLDLDGTIYQTTDLKECAFHATKANDRSVGIEIANMGAYPKADLAGAHLDRWYKVVNGQTQIQLPAGATVPTLPAGAPPLQPSRSDPVVGTIQGQELTQYDLTPQQYTALAKLTTGLCATFPKIRRDVPRDSAGKVVDRNLEPAVYDKYQGILGHYHVQLNKTDPGPAFQWDRILQPTP